MLITLKLTALLLAVGTAIPSVAHSLDLPGKLRLTREQYLAVQPIYYPGFTVLGVAEPLSIVALVALRAFTPGGTPPFWLTMKIDNRSSYRANIACDRLVAHGSEFNPNRPFHDSTLRIAYSPFVLAPPLAFHSQLERCRMSLIKVADTVSG